MNNEINEEKSYLDIQLSSFSGPLDLLVTLIKDKNIDIWEVDLAQIANQYLKIIENLQENDFDTASEYLVMAATLINLKAKMILQDPETQEEVSKEKIRLLAQIAEYQKFKEIAVTLKDNEQQRKEMFNKIPSNLQSFVKKTDENVVDGHSSVNRLSIILKKMFERTYAEQLKNISLSTKQVSPEEQKQRILELIKDRTKLSFEDIFTVPTYGHFVISLIALLDLARQQILVINHNENTEIIEVVKGEMYGK
ncbi:segregation/condensation protein A [[Mycoplasma] gypis]|uniref:Segregation and condensation protein A n=1 Tax=[Mycoplasma] gypis TaxID=92404 RepID=A0ABZ2RNU3_9BACT|nr:segregation/condensation protein A [[Mycoplasma] gypis]MBN0919256.1 segregation/condensation protein A [[Mycoplasma] gypis]